MWLFNAAFTTGSPFWGTYLLGLRIGRGVGALKWLSNRLEDPQEEGWSFPNQIDGDAPKIIRGLMPLLELTVGASSNLPQGVLTTRNVKAGQRH